MIEEIPNLIDQYVKWLKDKTKLRQLDTEWVEITTPYLDRHNDYIQIYAKKENSNFLLTDDGYTIEDLEQSGCKLQSSKRQELLRMTLNGFGVQLHENALQAHASLENFPLQKHNLVQAILAVNDMFFLSGAHVTSLFYENVVTWLDSKEIRYSPKIKFTGKSGFDHLFDFVIPKSRHQPERMLQTINHPDRNTAQSVAFAWFDTKDVRPADSKAFALLNDSEQKISATVFDALRNYGVTPIKWSERESVQQELAT